VGVGVCLCVTGCRCGSLFPTNIHPGSLSVTLFHVVLQQVDYLISQYTTAKNKVIYDLDSKSILGDLNVIQYLNTVTQYLCCLCGNYTLIRYPFRNGHMTH